jgi:hypothetical protein
MATTHLLLCEQDCSVPAYLHLLVLKPQLFLLVLEGVPLLIKLLYWPAK